MRLWELWVLGYLLSILTFPPYVFDRGKKKIIQVIIVNSTHHFYSNVLMTSINSGYLRRALGAGQACFHAF